jgi:hypothetical protein
MGRAVGIIFDTLYTSGNAILVPLEINHAVTLLMPTTLVAYSNPAIAVSATRSVLLGYQPRQRTTLM